MKQEPLYQYFVKAGASGCWVCAVDDTDAVKKACAKLGLSVKTAAADMQAYRIGKAGAQIVKTGEKPWQ